MGFRGFLRMMGRMQHMGMSAVSVMSRCLMMTSGVMTGRLLVMLCSMPVMLGGLQMMLMRWMVSVRRLLCHGFSP